MTQQSDSDPGTTLFPNIGNFHSMMSQELAGLTDAQLDFTSDQWAWAEWSIRRNTSHVSSGGLRWMLGRWGEANLAEGIKLPQDAMEIVNSGARWLDEGEVPQRRVDLSQAQGEPGLVRGSPSQADRGIHASYRAALVQHWSGSPDGSSPHRW